jgi:hypothetical protein
MRHHEQLETLMFAKLRTLAVLVLASTTLATAAIAAPVNIDVRIGPPPPRVEPIPVIRPGYVWTPGYWDWRGNRHHWVAGTWVRGRPGYFYSQPTWVQQGDRWHLNRGGWAHGGGDRDHDGVPNRYDRRPDNPYQR